MAAPAAPAAAAPPAAQPAAQPAQAAPPHGAAPAPKAPAKKKVRRHIAKAIAHIQATFNNTIITVADTNGETIAWSSAGSIGYKGSRKSTPFAAQRAAEKVADAIKKMGVSELDVKVKGPGSGRESAIRALHQSGLEIRTIEDVTPLPHNGCRPKKRRRV